MGQHILVISQYFYPEDFRINDICEEWIKRGYEVTVITGIPNYPKGKFFDGYGWFRKREETYRGIHVIRLPILPRGKKAFMLLLNYASFVVAGFFWKLFTRIKADKVFIFEVSPMTQALVGVWYARRRQIPCYIYVQDLWPENVEIVTGIHNRHILRKIDRMVDYIYRHCTRIFATSPSFVERIEERDSAWEAGHGDHEGCIDHGTGRGRSNVVYWPQYAEAFYRPTEERVQEAWAEEAGYKIIFTGNIGQAQGLDILPHAARILKDREIRCKFVMVGDGRYREGLEQEIEREQVQDMFLLLGRKPSREIPKYIACCDVAFVSFAANELFAKTIPAKLQSYMACGIPILAVADGETRRIVEEAACGIVCRLGDAEGLADGIVRFMELPEGVARGMGERALQYAGEAFDKGRLMDEMDRYVGG